MANSALARNAQYPRLIRFGTEDRQCRVNLVWERSGHHLFRDVNPILAPCVPFRRPIFDFPRGTVVRVLALASQKGGRSEEHTSELQSLMRISYAVFCLTKTTTQNNRPTSPPQRPTRLPTTPRPKPLN